jgi:hypothetical protein
VHDRHDEDEIRFHPEIDRVRKAAKQGTSNVFPDDRKRSGSFFDRGKYLPKISEKLLAQPSLLPFVPKRRINHIIASFQLKRDWLIHSDFFLLEAI